MNEPRAEAIVDRLEAEIRDVALTILDSAAVANQIDVRSSEEWRLLTDMGVDAGKTATFVVLHRHGMLTLGDVEGDTP